MPFEVWKTNYHRNDHLLLCGRSKCLNGMKNELYRSLFVKQDMPGPYGQRHKYVYCMSLVWLSQSEVMLHSYTLKIKEKYG